MGVLLIPLTIRFLPSQNAHLTSCQVERRVSPLDILRDVARNTNQRIALALSSCLMMGHFLIIPFLTPFLEFNKGFSKEEVSLVYVVGGVLTFFSSPILGKVADRWGKYRLFALMVGLSVAPILLITNLPDLPLFVVLAITGVWFIISSGRGIPAQALVSQVVPPARRGGFMSFNAALQQMFTGMASLIAGFIVTQPGPRSPVERYDWTGYLSLIVLGLALVWGYRLNKALQLSEASAAATAPQAKPVADSPAVH
jgi:DHA1 family inner membrane transport protein